jgi:hypothetical protein
MTVRKRIEVKSYGFDEYKQLVGTDPYGGASWLGLRVPTLPTSNLVPPGQPESSSRYLFMGCAFSVADGSMARLVGYRQLVEIGFVIPANGGPSAPQGPEAPAPAPSQPRPVILPVTTPGWSFPDATVTMHIRRLGPPNAQGLPKFTPSNTTDELNLRKGFSMSPSLLYQTIALPAGDNYYTDLTAYTPPNGARPYGSPLEDFPELGTIYGLDTDWKTPYALGALDAQVRGPDTIAAFISVAQTNPETRGALPVPQVPLAGSLGISPEDAFMIYAQSLNLEAIYWRVGVSMIFEVDSIVSAKRAAGEWPKG